MSSEDLERLRRTLDLAPYAQRAHPTTEHFLPLLVAAGASADASPISVLDGGFTHGVLLESYVFGDQRAAVRPSALLEAADA